MRREVGGVILSFFRDNNVDISKLRFYELKQEYGYTDLDTMLVLKDILYNEWRNWKK